MTCSSHSNLLFSSFSSARRLREVAFEAHNSSLAITVDTVTDAIYERMLHSTAQDLEHLVDDYSTNFLTGI